jgi:quercetin dioxygenase-like cupin family protein
MSNLDPQTFESGAIRCVQRAADVPVAQAEWGTLQWLVGGHNGASRNMTIGRVTFKPGMGNPTHLHPNCEEVLHVIAGDIEHTLPGGGTTRLAPGDSIVLEAGVWHRAVNVGADTAVVLVAFNSAQRQTVVQGEGSEG